jgi:hypothetical protein
MWPVVVYYPCMYHVALAIFGHASSSWRTFPQLSSMWPRRHGHDPGQATRTFLCMQTRTYTPAWFCWRSAGRRWWLLSGCRFDDVSSQFSRYDVGDDVGFQSIQPSSSTQLLLLLFLFCQQIRREVALPPSDCWWNWMSSGGSSKSAVAGNWNGFSQWDFGNTEWSYNKENIALLSGNMEFCGPQNSILPSRKGDIQ